MNFQIYADLRHTNCLIFAHIRPVRRHGLSTRERPRHFRPQPISMALLPSSRRIYQLSSHAGLITYNFHPPFRKFYQFIRLTNNIIFQAFEFLAIGLLVPQPRLISELLRHQRKLPYWCTKVCYSHQLKPNLAYSPQGRLLRKRRDSVFERGYVCTPPPSRTSVLRRNSRFTTQALYLLPAIVDKIISDSWYPQAGLGSRHDGIRSAPSCISFQDSLTN